MAGETVLTLVGDMTDAPELRYTQNGLPVANFTVASTPRHFDKTTNEWVDGATLFQRCTLWRDYAENAAASLSRGDRVVVSGVLVQEPEYDHTDAAGLVTVRRPAPSLVVDDIGPALKYARATVHKITKQEKAGTPWDTRDIDVKGAVVGA